MRLLVVALCLPACGWFSPPTASTPQPTAPVAPVASTASTVVLYEFVVELGPNRSAGTRIFDDGRVEVTAGGDDGSADWRQDRMLTPEQLATLRQRLQDPALAALPAKLPSDIRADLKAPPASWRLRVGDVEKRIQVEHYGGIRVPQLEALSQIIARAVDGDAAEVSTDWLIYREGHEVRATVPCHPGQTHELRSFTHLLLNPKDPVIPVPEAPAAPLAEITWREGTLVWSTRLLADGHVLRGRPDGSAVATLLNAEQLTNASAILNAIDWFDPKRLCARKLRPGSTGAEPPSALGALPPGAKLKGAKDAPKDDGPKVPPPL